VAPRRLLRMISDSTLDVVGGEWFQMWRSTAWNGLDPAFRNTVIALATVVLVYLDGRSTAAPQTEG
jgi:predicted small integral membrane protein